MHVPDILWVGAAVVVTVLWGLVGLIGSAMARRMSK